MLKTLGSTESITRLGKDGVGVGVDSGDNGSHDDGGSCNDDSNSNSSDALILICPPMPLTLMPRTSLSTNSSTSTTQIVVEYNGVNDGNG